MPKNSKLLVEFLKTQGTSLLLTISLASILTIALLSAVPNQAFAQQVDFEYRCYNTVSGVQPTLTGQTGKITLTDQFGTETYDITDAVEFCNPALKSPEAPPTTLPEVSIPHLRCWTILEEDGTNNPLNIQVSLDDQFDKTEHVVLDAVEFCHTTFKSEGSLTGSTGQVGYSGSNANNIANWICYNIDNPNTPSQPFRRLIDQFTKTNADDFPDGIEIGEALYLCTPATKVYDGGLFPPDNIKSLNQHMKCYDIIKEGTVDWTDPNPSGLTGLSPFVNPETIPLSDQFTTEDSQINMIDKICLDVVKDTSVAGTFIPLESVAILLAGAHMSSAWLIPALVALAGVGYGIDIARKYRKNTK